MPSSANTVDGICRKLQRKPPRCFICRACSTHGYSELRSGQSVQGLPPANPDTRRRLLHGMDPLPSQVCRLSTSV